MAFTLVQKAGYVSASGGASPSLAYSSNNTSGNLLIACVHEATSGFVDVNTFTITDTRSNTWKRAGFNTLQKTNMIFYCDGCAAGANTITVNGPSGSAITYVAIAEYSGQLAGHACDQFAFNEQVQNPSMGIWAAGANCLVIGQFADNGAGSTWSGLTGLTQQALSSPTVTCGWGDNANGLAGENIWNLTQSPADNLCCSAIFLPATYKTPGTCAMVRTVQFASSDFGTRASSACTFSSGNQSGNAIIFIVNFANFSANQATGVPTDTAGNTYSLITSFHGSQGLNNFWAVYRADPCNAIVGINTITIGCTNQAYSVIDSFAVEITGQNSGAAVDATASDNNGTTSKSFAISTTQANDLLFALFCHPTGGQTWSGYSGTRTYSLSAINNGSQSVMFTSQPPLNAAPNTTIEDHFFQAAPNSGSQTITASGTGPFAIFVFAIKGLAAAATPTFNPVSGTPRTTSVSISTSSGGASIYYTTDGSTPTPSSTLYTGPVTINGTVTIKAIASGGGFSNSAVATGTWQSPVTTTQTQLRHWRGD